MGCQFPGIHQLILVKPDPGKDTGQLGPGKLSSRYSPIDYLDCGTIAARIPNMYVGRTVILELDLDNDPIKTTQLRHSSIRLLKISICQIGPDKSNKILAQAHPMTKSHHSSFIFDIQGQ